MGIREPVRALDPGLEPHRCSPLARPPHPQLRRTVTSGQYTFPTTIFQFNPISPPSTFSPHNCPRAHPLASPLSSLTKTSRCCPYRETATQLRTISYIFEPIRKHLPGAAVTLPLPLSLCLSFSHTLSFSSFLILCRCGACLSSTHTYTLCKFKNKKE